VIDAEKLADIREESVKVVGGYGNSWSSGYVRNRAAITLELLDEIARLQKLVKEAPFKLGDVVREVGEEEPTGKIVQIKEGEVFERAYVVHLFDPPPTANFTTITYYHDEIELIERKHD